ncbi:MAG TPA: tetratricopeptide repeat protein [Syntrophobacteria bacterium]|nr:tetratricopeptide repeat protein [Syntrophobacteria bacterium]
MDEVELYRQMLTKDPSSQVFVYLAEALFERSMFAEAIETCLNGLRLHPHDLRARVILGLSYLRTEKLDRAEVELLRAKEILEINMATYQGLAELYERRGDEEMSSLYRRLFDVFQPLEVLTAAEPEESPRIEPEIELPAAEEPGVATVTMAELYAQQGHLDKAAAIYRTLLETAPESPEVSKRLAELERKAKTAETNAKLASMLEKLCDNLKNRPSPGAVPG